MPDTHALSHTQLVDDVTHFPVGTEESISVSEQETGQIESNSRKQTAVQGFVCLVFSVSTVIDFSRWKETRTQKNGGKKQETKKERNPISLKTLKGKKEGRWSQILFTSQLEIRIMMCVCVF